jgi:hypothetical protein
MSVRPITHSEQRLAYGEPYTTWFAIMGATQGLLSHLRFNGATVQGSWFPTQMARFTLPVFMLGGTALGVGFGVFFFGDD